MLDPIHAAWIEDQRGIPSEIAIENCVISVGADIAFDYGTYRKIRTSGKNYRIEPLGQAPRFFLEETITRGPIEGEPLVITEGEFDCLVAKYASFASAVSVPNGASAGKKVPEFVDEDTAFKYLWPVKSKLMKYHKIVLATDNDEKGWGLRDALAVRIGKARCFYLKYPKDCKDLNEVLLKHGVDVVHDLIVKARPLGAQWDVSVDDLPDAPPIRSYGPGWKQLERNLRIVMPELITVAGAPGSGKTQWVMNLVWNLSLDHSLPCGWLQFEGNAYSVQRDCRRYSEFNEEIIRVRHSMTPRQWRDKFFRFLPLTMRAVQPDGTRQDRDFKWLRERIEELVFRRGCKVVVIDPWNQIEHAFGVNETETAYTCRALNELQELTEELDICLIIITHPTKSGGLKNADDEMTLYDVAGSAHWANKSNAGIIIKRRNLTTIIEVVKQKDWEVMGKPGEVGMTFDKSTASYTEISESDLQTLKDDAATEKKEKQRKN